VEVHRVGSLCIAPPWIGPPCPGGHHRHAPPFVPPWLEFPIVTMPMPPGYTEPDDPTLPVIE